MIPILLHPVLWAFNFGFTAGLMVNLWWTAMFLHTFLYSDCSHFPPFPVSLFLSIELLDAEFAPASR